MLQKVECSDGAAATAKDAGCQLQVPSRHGAQEWLACPLVAVSLRALLLDDNARPKHPVIIQNTICAWYTRQEFLSQYVSLYCVPF